MFTEMLAIMKIIEPDTIELLMNDFKNLFREVYNTVKPKYELILKKLKENPNILETLCEIYNFEKDAGIKVSDEDDEKIKRITELGFDYNAVLDAFLLCDRNENMTVEFLLNDN